MKKLFVTTVFTLSVWAAAAQTGGGNQTGQPVASSDRNYLSSVSTNDNIRQLANQMQLNEGQYIRFRDLTRTKNEQTREINNMYANDMAARNQRLQALNQDYEKQLAQTVSQEQFTAYLATQGRAPANNQNSNFEAAGYGGQSLENGAATGTSNNGGAVNPNDTNNSNNMVISAPASPEKKKNKANKETRWHKRNTGKEKLN